MEGEISVAAVAGPEDCDWFRALAWEAIVKLGQRAVWASARRLWRAPGEPGLRCWLVRRGLRPVGAMLTECVTDCLEPYLHVELVYVQPGHGGPEVRERLLAAVKQEARRQGLRSVRADVVRPGLYRLLQARGFKPFSVAMKMEVEADGP